MNVAISYTAILMSLGLSTFCNPQHPVVNRATRYAVIIHNPLAVTRNNETITLQRAALKNIPDNLFPLVKCKNKTAITQAVDEDSNGVWDELLIEVSLAPGATDTLIITWVNKTDKPAFNPSAGVYLSLRSENGLPSPLITQAIRYRGFTQNIAKPFYQMEGPGIENDKVAFRSFFDYRNGKDIYGKIVDTPVLSKVGVGATWHELQPWGMDILKVGNSLGAGALAVLDKQQIFRLGDADTTTFSALYEGALQAAFALTFKNWDVAGSKENGSERLSITKGNYYYKNTIQVPLKSGQQLIAGIANFMEEKAVYQKHNAKFSSISTYGKQAEGTLTNLGLAILFPANDYIENKTAAVSSVIPNTSYVALRGSNIKTIYFFACWEKTDSRFKDQQGFSSYLNTMAQLLANPIQIKILANN